MTRHPRPPASGPDRGRRRTLAGLAALPPLLHAGASLGQPPGSALGTLLVPWPAGGATDITLRLLAELAGPQLGRKYVVENKPGAGGSLAMPLLLQAPADGSVLAQLPHPVLRLPFIQKVGWDPLRDTSPILQLSGVSFGILVPAHSPWQQLDELLAYARRHPGALSVATNGAGTTPHRVMDELLGSANYLHVPYKGTAEQMLALASGQVMAGINSSGFAPYVDNGRLRLLATCDARRSRRWPQVPTLQELGHPIVANSPYGLVGPRGLTPEVVQQLHEAFRSALFHPRHLAELARYDQEPAYLGPADYARALARAYEQERRLAERPAQPSP